MKKISTLSVLLLAGIFVSAQKVTINTKGLLINDVQISKDWTLSEFKKILGEPSKYVLATSTYNDKGIVLYEKTKKNGDGTGNVEIMVLYFLRDVITNPFKGEFSVEDVKLGYSTSKQQLDSVLTGWKPGKCKHCYVKGDISLVCAFNDNETRLLRVSINH